MPKVSKLIPDQTLEKYRACGLEMPVGRCIGQSTGAALKLIGEAMHNPEISVRPPRARPSKIAERI